MQYLLDLGFRPELTRAALWRRAWVVFGSPWFYARGVGGRLASNSRSRGWRLVGVVVWLGAWLSVPFWALRGGWVALLAFAVPVLLFAQLSALLDRLGEHEWLAPRDPALGRRFYTASSTAARFCGAPVPARGTPVARQAVAWVRWIVVTVPTTCRPGCW